MSLAATVELHNVKDAEAFVAAAVAKVLAQHSIRLGFHDREDLEAFGLMTMLDLAAKYRPAHAVKREGWAEFSGYAASMLPRRLIDELRKRGSRTRRPDGSRAWEPRIVDSLDALMEAPAFESARVRRVGSFERPAALAA